jgi:NAD(P)-dependent dehydrogenase (short-subunit alcohol dehydrogenase family)
MTFKPLDSLDGQVAVITGAMGGIGYATAQRLSARGARIFGIVRRDVEQAQAKLNELPNADLKHTALLADVTSKDQLKEALAAITQDAGKCNILVNTHGRTRRIPHEHLQMLSDDFFDQMLQENLRSYFSVIRTFEPLLKSTNESLIVNIGSLAGQGNGGGSNLAYVCAKAGIDALTRNLAKAMAPVRVMGVNPGILETKFVPNQRPELYEYTVKQTPLKRIPTVEDIGAAVEACATLLRFTNGHVIAVDGGRTL